jgi:hypothetical protein
MDNKWYYIICTFTPYQSDSWFVKMLTNKMITAYHTFYNFHELNILLFFSSLITIYYDCKQYHSLDDAVSHNKPPPQWQVIYIAPSHSKELLLTHITCHWAIILKVILLSFQPSVNCSHCNACYFYKWHLSHLASRIFPAACCFSVYLAHK